MRKFDDTLDSDALEAVSGGIMLSTLHAHLGSQPGVGLNASNPLGVMGAGLGPSPSPLGGVGPGIDPLGSSIAFDPYNPSTPPYGVTPGAPYGASPYGTSPYGVAPGAPYGVPLDAPYGASPYGAISPYGPLGAGPIPYGQPAPFQPQQPSFLTQLPGIINAFAGIIGALNGTGAPAAARPPAPVQSVPSANGTTSLPNPNASVPFLAFG